MRVSFTAAGLVRESSVRHRRPIRTNRFDTAATCKCPSALASIRFAAASCLALATAAAGQTTQQTIVPAFFGINQLTDPQNGAVPIPYDWTRIEQAGTAVKAVVADGSFPFLTDDCPLDGTGMPLIPTDCHALGVIGLCQAKCQFKRNRTAGQKVFGYVMTGSGTRDYDYTKNGVLVHNCSASANHKCVLTGGDLVLPVDGGYKDTAAKHMPSVQQWYNAFCPSPTDQSVCFIDGIFFDVGPSSNPVSTGSTPLEDSVQMADYQNLFADFKDTRAYGPCSDSTHPARPCLMINAPQFANSWAASVADYFILWERALHGKDQQPPDNQDYLANFQPISIPSWWTSISGSAEHVIAVANQNDVAAIVQASRTPANTTGYRGAPSFLYIHDRFTYGGLSCFFEREIDVLQNQQPPRAGKTWCDATRSCLDINTTPCPPDLFDVIIVTDPSTGNKIPIVLSL